MPYTLTWEDRVVVKRFFGKVTYEEYARSQEQVLGDARTDDIRLVINDLRQIEGYAVSTSDAEYFAAFNRGAAVSNPLMRVAYLTTDRKMLALIHLVSRISSLEIKTFATEEEARAWGRRT